MLVFFFSKIVMNMSNAYITVNILTQSLRKKKESFLLVNNNVPILRLLVYVDFERVDSILVQYMFLLLHSRGVSFISPLSNLYVIEIYGATIN